MGKPKTAVLTFGALKYYKAQADFVSGFLQAGGLEVSWSPPLETVEEAIAYIQTESIDYAIVCGEKDIVIDIMPNLLKANDSGRD